MLAIVRVGHSSSLCCLLGLYLFGQSVNYLSVAAACSVPPANVSQAIYSCMGLEKRRPQPSAASSRRCTEHELPYGVGGG